MASELERLLLTFEADTAKLRKALAEADSGVATFESKADRNLGRAARNFSAFDSKIAGHMRSVGAAIIGAFSLQAVQAQLKAVETLERTARAAGLTTTELQHLQAAASATGVDVGQLGNITTKFAVTMGEFRTKTGDFYEFIRTQLPALESQLRATKSQGEAFAVVADAVSRLQSAEDRALFTKKALGESSVFLVQALMDGRRGLDDAAASADKYGHTISKEAIEATVALKKEIDDLGKTLSTRFTENIAKAAPALTAFLRGWRDGLAKNDNRQFLGPFGVMFGEALDKAAQEGAAKGPAAAKVIVGNWKTSVEKEAAALKLQVKIPDFTTEIDFTAADALSELARKHAEAVGDSGAVIRLEYEKEVEVFRRMLADKKISEAEYQMAREQLSVAMGAKIAAAYEEETKHVREALDSVKTTIENSLSKPLDDFVRTGKLNFRELITDMVAQLAKLSIQASIIKPALDALLSPSGAGGSIGAALAGAGSLFGGFRAGGGGTNRGQPYVVGERGPEIFVPSTAGRIVPSGQGMASPAGNTYVDARGAEIGVEERVRAVMLEMERTRPGPAAAVSKARARFPTRKAA